MTHRSKSTGAVTIAAGAALSSAGNTGDKILCAILMPAVWTAACLTFQASDDGGNTWNELYDDSGNEVTIASADVVAGRRINLVACAADFVSVDFLKIRSGTSAAPVNQVAAATITLVYRKLYALG